MKPRISIGRLRQQILAEKSKLDEMSPRERAAYISQRRAEKKRQLLKLNVAELPIPTRTVNILDEAGVQTVRQLIRLTQEQLLDIESFGERSLEDVYQALADIGLIEKSKKVA